MTPIEMPFTPSCSERDKKMREEIQSFIGGGWDAAVLWKDETVTCQRNIELYKRNLRVMRLKDYEFCQRNKKVIIKKKDVRL